MSVPVGSPLFPADSPAVTAHINLLQGIINRLANNSASCKTWCITLVGALVSLAGATHVPGIVTFALAPVVIFGFGHNVPCTRKGLSEALYKHDRHHPRRILLAPERV
jgi:hypothetical protein